MDEFVTRIRRQTAAALQALSGQQPTPGVDPILELVALLMEENGSRSESEVELAMDQWLLWNQLAMDRPQVVAEAMNSVLETEKVPLPPERAAMAAWAAWLVTSTLDRIETE